MKKKFSVMNIISCVIIAIFGVLTIINPEPFKNGVVSGILLCGRVIIPSLFPFTVCVLFIQKSGITEKLNFMTPVTNKILGLPAPLFAVMLLSMVGGYPIGAKLLDSLAEKGNISESDAARMLNFCINAGPAFIVSAVGSSILQSKFAGYILLFCQITASFLICISQRLFKLQKIQYKKSQAESLNPADNFVLSTAQASSAIGKICSFVVLFSAINGYTAKITEIFPKFRTVALLLEVTNACTTTRNIYLLAFLLGFGGICVWLQIFALSGKIKINILKFSFFRIIHGVLSALLVKLFCTVSGYALPTLSNLSNVKTQIFYSAPQVAVSMLVMSIIFVISVSGKKYTGKILGDVV